MEKNTKPVQTLIDLFDDTIEEKETLDEASCKRIASCIDSRENLENGLPLLLKKAMGIKENVENCDKNIKTWQASKKTWAERSNAFHAILGEVIKSLHLPGNSLKAEGVKLAMSSRTSLEVDEDWLLGQYSPLAGALQKQLPDYLKVTIALDKTKLTQFLKADNSMLINYPEKIHTKTSTSTSIR
jgi:hypothetical protein